MKKVYLLTALLVASAGNIFANEPDDTESARPQSILIDPLEQTTHAGHAIQAANQFQEANQLNQTNPDYTEVRETLLDWLDLIKQNPTMQGSAHAFQIVQNLNTRIQPHLPRTALNLNLNTQIGRVRTIMNNAQQNNNNNN